MFNKLLQKFQTKKPDIKQSQQLQTATFSISGMHCTSCSLNIDGTLEDIVGVKQANTSYAKARTTISYNPNVVKAAELQAAIEELGYRVKSLIP
jgi:copper chaperone CopZ